MTEMQIVKRLAVYLYNTSPDQVITDVYGENIHEDYRQEKVRSLKKGFSLLFGKLDDQGQQRFVAVAMEKGG